MTPAQLKLLGMARSAAHKATALDDADYRTILRSVAHVESSKEIRTPEQFERVMALLEERGYRHPKGERHFRNKIARINDGCVTDRQLRAIDTLSAASSYALPGLCRRFSADRTDQPHELTAGEAYNLIEMLKAATERRPRGTGGPPVSSPPLPDPDPMTDDDVPF